MVSWYHVKTGIMWYFPQAAARKDVERAFGILQAQFAIVRGPASFWDKKMLWYMMHACVIMHNMIIENERGQDLDYSQYELLGHPVWVRRRAERVARFVASYHVIRRPATHNELQKDLIEEWWVCHGWQRAWFLHSTLYCSLTICCVYCSICCTER